jgi:hypothetical protein
MKRFLLSRIFSMDQATTMGALDVDSPCESIQGHPTASSQNPSLPTARSVQAPISTDVQHSTASKPQHHLIQQQQEHVYETYSEILNLTGPKTPTPLDLFIVAHEGGSRLPISMEPGDNVAFAPQKTLKKDSLLFGIIQQVKEHQVVVRLKMEGDSFYNATGVLCRVSRFDLVSTDLIAAHTGKNVYYGGPHSYCKNPVYTWWSEPDKCGKFTMGDLI